MGWRENREYYLGRGLCPRCGGENPVAEGRSECAECSERVSRARKEQREYRRENRLCTRCGAALPEGSRYKTCSRCRRYISKFYAFNHERYNRLKEEGRCVKCGGWAEPGKTMCRGCLDEHKKTELSYGEEYREKKRQRRRDRMAAGLCIDCGRPSDGGHSRCRRCRDMRMDSVRKYRITKRIEREAEKARGKV